MTSSTSKKKNNKGCVLHTLFLKILKMIKNKKFIDLTNGKVFEVIDQFEDIAILDNKAKVKVGKLLDKTFYDEYIDPNSFFRNDRLVNAFTEKIRQLPIDDSQQNQKYDNFVNESMRVEASVSSTMNPLFTDSAVLPYDPEDEKRELLEKAKRMYKSQNGTNIDNLRHLLDEDVEDYQPRPSINGSNDETPINDYIPPQPQLQPASERVVPQVPIQQNQNMDPIISMFRNVKRNNDFSLSFSINHKIPRLDFIEMMEDSYNTSIIDFLAEEFTNIILLNPNLIKNKISEEIRNLVFGRHESQDSTEDDTQMKTTKKTKAKND